MTVPSDGESHTLSSSNERNEYLIKKVVDCRMDAFNVYYKVKWHSSWLPAHSLVDCEHLVHQYWATCNSSKTPQQYIETTSGQLYGLFMTTLRQLSDNIETILNFFLDNTGTILRQDQVM